MKQSHRHSLSLIVTAVSSVLVAGTVIAQTTSPSGSSAYPSGTGTSGTGTGSGTGAGAGGNTGDSSGTGAGSARRSTTGDSSGTGALSSASLSPASFVKQASEDGMAEVQLGKLAQQKGGSDEVRSYGQMMVRDHEQANAELKTVASAKKLTIATEPSSDQRKMMQQLTAKSGKEFDTAFVNHMADDHSKAVALFQQAAQSSDPEIARFASKTLPTLQNHKQMADTLRTQRGSKSGGTSGTGSGSGSGSYGTGAGSGASGTGSSGIGSGSGTGGTGSGGYGTGSGTGSGSGVGTGTGTGASGTGGYGSGGTGTGSTGTGSTGTGGTGSAGGGR